MYIIKDELDHFKIKLCKNNTQNSLSNSSDPDPEKSLRPKSSGFGSGSTIRYYP
jgi:hypothetical protein